MKINNKIYGTLLNNLNIYSKSSLQATKMLSTGKRINSASDSPSDMLRLSRLNSKINGTAVSNRNIHDGISLIQTTENSLNEINNIGKRLKELSVTYNNSTISEQDKSLIEKESKALLNEINNIQKNTNFNNKNVFSQKDYIIQTGSDYNDSYNINISGINIDKFIEKKEDNSSKSLTQKISTALGNNELEACHLNIGTNDKIVVELNGYPEITSPGNFKDTPTFNVSDGYQTIYNDKGTLIYQGDIVNGKCSGYGTLYNDDGSLYYDGEFTNGIYDTYGTFYNKDGNIIYQGGLKNGECDGFGSQYFDDNIKYEGNFSDGNKNGYGTLSKDDTIIYQGDWKNNKPVTGMSSNETITLPNNGDINKPSDDNNGDINKPSDDNGNNGDINKPSDDNDDHNILLGDNIDKYILSPLADSLNSLGIQERILTHRYELNESQNVTRTEHLSNIEDVDTASALLEKIKSDILVQTNTSLFSEQLTQNRGYILSLLS